MKRRTFSAGTITSVLTASRSWISKRIKWWFCMCLQSMRSRIIRQNWTGEYWSKAVFLNFCIGSCWLISSRRCSMNWCVCMVKNSIVGFMRNCGSGYLIWILFLWLKCRDILMNHRKIIWKRNFCVLHIIWLLSGNLVLFIISIRAFTVLRKRKRL